MKIPKVLIFNFFTKQSFDKLNSLNFFGRRLNSVLLDFSFMLGLVFPIFIVLFIPMFLLITNANEVNILLPMWIGFIPFSFITFLILNKDFFKGKSVAKRYFGYQVVDSGTNEPASELQCVIRNSTIIIWPLEVIISMFNVTRRLGDIIAGTKLVDSKKEDPELIVAEINEKKEVENRSKLILISVLIALTLNILSVLPTLIIML